MRHETHSIGVLTVDKIIGPGAPGEMGIGQKWYVDAENGSNGNSGKTAGTALATIAAGYATMTGDQNDTLFALPGAYAPIASLAWDKNQTHLIGVGGPNQRYCPTTLTDGAIQVKCTTTSIDNIFDVTGDYCRFEGFQTMNTYSAAANRCDFLITGKNTYFYRMRLRGGNGANQLNHADGGVPIIFAGAAGAGNGFLAEYSAFGSAGNNARTVGAGAVLFEGGAICAFSPTFRHCTFEMRCETGSSSNPKLIHLAQNNAVDRLLLFDKCDFYNFYINLGGLASYVIVDGCGTTHLIGLKNCFMYGFTYWSDVAKYCFSNLPAGNGYGGKAVVITTG